MDKLTIVKSLCDSFNYTTPDYRIFTNIRSTDENLVLGVFFIKKRTTQIAEVSTLDDAINAVVEHQVHIGV